jgi:hypothetical protein
MTAFARLRNVINYSGETRTDQISIQRRTVLSLVAFLTFLGASGTALPQGPEYRAARAALLVVRSVLQLPKGDLHNEGYILNAETRRMVDSQVVEALVSLPKPLSCTSEFVGDTIWLNCETLTDPRAREFQSIVAENRANWLQSRVRAYSPGDLSDPVVELRSDRDTLVLRLSDVVSFYRDYFVPHLLTVEPPDVRAAPGDTSAILFVNAPPEVGRLELHH